jgi:hypothetical protein
MVASGKTDRTVVYNLPQLSAAATGKFCLLAYQSAGIHA